MKGGFQLQILLFSSKTTFPEIFSYIIPVLPVPTQAARRQRGLQRSGQAGHELPVVHGVGAHAGGAAHGARPAPQRPGEAHQEHGQREERQQGRGEQRGDGDQAQQDGEEGDVERDEGGTRFAALLLLRPRRQEDGDGKVQLGDELEQPIPQEANLQETGRKHAVCSMFGTATVTLTKLHCLVLENILAPSF